MHLMKRSSRPMSRVFAVLLTTTMVGIALPEAMAQTPPPAAPPKAGAAKKPAPPKKPAGQPTQPAQPSAAQQQQPPLLVPPLIYRRWTKVCPKDPSAPDDAPKRCYVFAEGIDDLGVPVTRITIVGMEGDPQAQNRVLIVSFIYGVDLQGGTRVAIDDGPMAARAAYTTCLPPNVPPPVSACISQYAVNEDVIKGLKKGKSLTVQTIWNGRTLSPQFPLENFAAAYDGPPTDLKAEAEQAIKLQEELKKRAMQKQDELSKKSNQPASK
jgi:invasion protein IalB